MMQASATEAKIIVDSPPEPDQARNSGKSLHTFVISWSGKHDNAERIAKAVVPTSNSVTVIYSDPNRDLSIEFLCPSIKRPNNFFFSDKFQACIDSCDADIILIIHADCHCDHWREIPERCKHTIEQNPDIGVWAPRIDFSDWRLERTEIAKIPDSSFSIVAQTDGIVVGLTRQIVDRMRKVNLTNNVYGWGIDLLFNCYTYSIGKISVVDRSIFVRHPATTEYSTESAFAEQCEFVKQLTPAERTQSALLDEIVHLHDRIKEAGTKDPTAAADAKRELALLSQRILGGENAAKTHRPMRFLESVRLWFVDLWGDGWNRSRRRLLFKHFWAYARRP
jgi:hypothetical protein